MSPWWDWKKEPDSLTHGLGSTAAFLQLEVHFQANRNGDQKEERVPFYPRGTGLSEVGVKCSPDN